MVRGSISRDGVCVSKNGKILSSTGDGLNDVLNQVEILARGNSLDEDSSKPLAFTQDPSNVIRLGDIKVSPWGVDNLLPNSLIEIVYGNNLMPGLIEFKEDMIFGQGVKFVDGSGKECKDKELLQWLDSWDYESYIQSQISDYTALYNIFGQFVKTRGGKVAYIEHIPAVECRCEVMKNNRVENIVVADWKYKPNDYKVFPVYAPKRDLATQKNITMYHHYRQSVGYKYYGMPKYIGATKFWIPLVNQIPKYHLSMISNSLNALYHVKIPMEVLEKKKQANGWSSKELDRWVEERVDSIDEMLTGANNAGKTFYSFTSKDMNSSAILGWEITPIDNKAKQLSEGYLKLFNDGNQAITSAMQVQPSLACIQLGDKLSSGSEVLNSYNLHMQTRTQIPRKIILKALNMALKINFPNLDVRAAFDNVLLVHQDKNVSGVQNGGL